MGRIVIFTDFFKALDQIGDPRFRRVLFAGIGLTLGLLFAIYLVFAGAISLFFPESLTLPLIGEITWVKGALSWATIPVMLLLSTFLMVPVASAFTSLFLDTVADAVEDVHYPHLSQAPRTPFLEGVKESIVFLGVLIGANLLALILYLFLPFFAPLIFWLLNGFLLGREYFQLVAVRRLGRAGAHEMRARHSGQIWMAGALMAVPLSVPVVNLFIPVLGAATFTHLFHRLNR